MAWYSIPNTSQPVATPWSQMSIFTTGLRNLTSWTAQWIQGGPQLTVAFAPAAVTCTDVLRASMFVSGLGWYVAYIDGQAVDNRQLDVGWTRYDRRVLYSTFDVTALVCPTPSGPLSVTIEVELGGGHFSDDWYTGLPFQGQLLLQLVRVYGFVLLSHERWRLTVGGHTECVHIQRKCCEVWDWGWPVRVDGVNHQSSHISECVRWSSHGLHHRWPR